MASKFAYTMEQVAATYPQFTVDRIKYEKRVIIESLQWRVDHPTANNLSVRKDSIHNYFPYLDKEAVRTVQSTFRNRFYDNRDDVDYSKYWNEPALAQVFKHLDKTNAALTKVFIDKTNADGEMTAGFNFVPNANIDNVINIEYNGLVFKGKLKSEAHFYTIIDAVKNF